MPAYLALCMKTWQRFLPDHAITLIDYSNVNQWLNGDDLDLDEVKRLPLATQSDAFRAALLAKHGGIWMDVDTIITSDNVAALIPAMGMLTLIGRHCGFVTVDAPNHPIANGWLCNVRRRLHYAKLYRRSAPECIRFARLAYSHFFHTKPPLINTWDFLANGALEPVLDRFPDQFRSLDKKELGALPEIILSNDGTSTLPAYQKFYFDCAYCEEALRNFSYNKGIVCLHNSWTPKRFAKMSETEFLRSEIPLAKILKRLV